MRGRVEVVPEEAQGRPGDDGADGGGVLAAQRRCQHGERQRGDPAEAGGQPVHAVDEVDDVGNGDDPDDRHRVLPPSEVEHAEHRQRDVVDGDAQERGIDAIAIIPPSLTRRVQRVDVVQRAEHRHQRGAGDDPPEAVVVAQSGSGDGDGGEDGKPAEQRRRPGVEPALLGGRVDDPRPPGGLGNDRRQQHGQQERDQEADGSGLLVKQRAVHRYSLLRRGGADSHKVVQRGLTEWRCLRRLGTLISTESVDNRELGTCTT